MIRIEAHYDGWYVYDENDDGDEIIASWNHNDPDMGTEAIRQLLDIYLGIECYIEEVY